MDYKPRQIPKGLICPLISPIKEDHSLATESYHRLLDHVLPHVDGIVICDSIWGEGLFLSNQTKLDIVDTTLSLIDKDFPVFICITSKTEENTIAFFKSALSLHQNQEINHHIYWIDYPLIYHSNRGLPQFYEELFNDPVSPFIIGNLPSQVQAQKGITHHKNIQSNVLSKIAQNKALEGIFYSGSFKRSLDYHSIFRSKKRFTFYDLNESVFLKNPGQGGVVPGGSNLIPKIWKQITDTCLGKSAISNHYSSRLQIFNAAQMAQDLYLLYQKNPVFILKKILHQSEILDTDFSITSNDKHRSSFLQNQIDTFLKTYDML